MNLSRARRMARIGQYACPVSFLLVLIATWKSPPVGGLIAAVVTSGVCMTHRAFSKWLEDADEERSELGEQLVQTQKILALGEISTGIAHEINNPLNVIMQEAELMRMNLLSDPQPAEVNEIRESLDVIYNQVERCSDITHKLLDFARNRHPVSQRADINRLVEDMLALVEREASPRNIRIFKELNDVMPMVQTDPPLLRQVFLNLLINAVQAVEDGGTIVVSTYCDGGMACAEVRDDGPGIASSDLERVFNPFFTTKPPGKGTGLGLSVSLRIVNELGGDIKLKSEPGNGAAFTVRIPLNN